MVWKLAISEPINPANPISHLSRRLNLDNFADNSMVDGKVWVLWDDDLMVESTSLGPSAFQVSAYGRTTGISLWVGLLWKFLLSSLNGLKMCFKIKSNLDKNDEVLALEIEKENGKIMIYRQILN